ncbi:WAS/WASL-interacting protein family member 1-like [Zea mays]|uniref:Uncharacterized protein n=1 Tax=Zea mays TaxID=4577 RepID=A0A804N3R1_MAIZE|nr:WAS/WASL-interacting protein family member 1-like [Zea mays]|eukprot:XP_020406405.1 WAS/WASL-interacting protein family member 1-like [Zea mays]
MGVDIPSSPSAPWLVPCSPRNPAGRAGAILPARMELPRLPRRELDAPVQPTPSSSRGRASTLVLGSSPPMAPPPTSFAQPLCRPSSLLPPSPMQQHMSSPPPSSSLSRPGNTGSRALSLVWVEQRLPCYLLPDAPSRWHPTAPAPSLLRLAATAVRVPCVRQNVEGGVLLQHRRRSPVGRCFAQPPTAPSKPVLVVDVVPCPFDEIPSHVDNHASSHDPFRLIDL